MQARGPAVRSASRHQGALPSNKQQFQYKRAESVGSPTTAHLYQAALQARLQQSDLLAVITKRAARQSDLLAAIINKQNRN